MSSDRLGDMPSALRSAADRSAALYDPGRFGQIGALLSDQQLGPMSRGSASFTGVRICSGKT
jgi:hypothetical protein